MDKPPSTTSNGWAWTAKRLIHIGESSRGGKTRGDNQASDHDIGCKEKYIPCGIGDEDTGQPHLSFGSSDQTSDLIVDTLQQWWNGLTPQQQRTTHLLQLKFDNGSESSSVRILPIWRGRGGWGQSLIGIAINTPD